MMQMIDGVLSSYQAPGLGLALLYAAGWNCCDCFLPYYQLNHTISGKERRDVSTRVQSRNSQLSQA